MTEATEAAAKAKEPRGGYVFSMGTPATIECTFEVPTLPGSPRFTHLLRRNVSGVQMSDFLERLTSFRVGVAKLEEKETRRVAAELSVYCELMSDDVPGCGVRGYADQDALTPSQCVEFFSNGFAGVDADTLSELRRHIGYAISSWLRQKTADGSFR